MKQTKPTEDNAGAQLSCHNLWKIFGANERRHAAALQRSPDSIDLGDDAAAVKNVSFDVKPAETLVVMGLSGSGKSTLIRCLTRLIEPTSGSVTLDDHTVTEMNSTELREFRRHQCAMVFQHFGLFPHRRVLDNVAYGLEVRGVKRDVRERQARELLQLVGLAEWEQRYPSELSGGMKQRVGLARALAVKPRLLLFDEPFSALDPLIRRDLQDELIRLRETVRKTMIFITHDMAEALKLGDRIAIMRDGELVQIGSPEEIILSPANDYVSRFVSEAPRTRVIRAATLAETHAPVPASTPHSELLSFLGGSSNSKCFPVLDGQGTMIGATTELDIRVASPESDAGMLARPVPRVTADTDLETVMQLLANGSHPAIAVLNDSRELQGMINAQAILRALIRTDVPPASSGGDGVIRQDSATMASS